MGLEAATYIDGLVITNPDGSDNKSQGDDHIRLIKSTLKNTFPNINGAVTPTEEQINVLASPGTTFLPGMIIMWGGTAATVPAGWKLCNGVGTISNGSPVPNLRDRFIICSTTDTGGNYNIGNTGGNKDQIVSGTSQSHILTTAQIPAHTHAPNGNSELVVITGGGAIENGAPGAGLATTDLVSVGGNQGHTHGISITTVNGNLPPYYALAFIIKD